MGKVKQKSRKWIETEFGTPQGAILSPLLSNLYLHSFDQFAISRHLPYIRYADDFLFLCESKEQAQDLAEKIEQYLSEKLKLTKIQYQSMCKRLARLVVRREDWVNIYPLCTECYARIEYIPPVKKKEPVKIVVV